MGWVLREYYTDMDMLLDKYKAKGLKLLKKDGWFLDKLDKAQSTNTRNLHTDTKCHVITCSSWLMMFLTGAT